MKNRNLILDHFWVWLSYLLAISAGYLTVVLLPGEPVWLRLLIADVVATVVVFAFSMIFNNSSVYDPYWSVIPIFLALGYWGLAEEEGDPTRQGVAMVIVTLYGVRLTYNWARGWRGMGHEDWRYVDFRHKFPRAYWLISFLGIHLMPTLLVFLGCLPFWSIMAGNSAPFGLADAGAALVALAAILIEGVADNQLRRFRKTNPPKGSIMQTGLWAYSRHPNYFGEILFWWGLALFVLLGDLQNYWQAAGALAINLLFVFISLPLIEQRMRARRLGYEEHRRRVSRLIPWLPRKGD